MQKFLTICLIMCLLTTIELIPAYAFSEAEDEISPMAMYYVTATANLSISSAGKATATGTISGLVGTTTKTTVHLYLQKYENGEWVDVEDWVESNETVNTSLTKTKSALARGKYRAKASCYAYSGSDYERVIKYSSEVTY